MRNREKLSGKVCSVLRTCSAQLDIEWTNCQAISGATVGRKRKARAGGAQCEYEALTTGHQIRPPFSLIKLTAHACSRTRGIYYQILHFVSWVSVYEETANVLCNVWCVTRHFTLPFAPSGFGRRRGILKSFRSRDRNPEVQRDRAKCKIRCQSRPSHQQRVQPGEPVIDGNPMTQSKPPSPPTSTVKIPPSRAPNAPPSRRTGECAHILRLHG